MLIHSSAFESQHPIPKPYTCEGNDLSPPLSFAHIPDTAKSLVLIVDDPDAPNGTFDHWVVWNLSPDMTSLEEGVTLHPPVCQGVNGFHNNRYGGPCPPKGAPHHYYFKLYALDTILSLPNGSSKIQVENAMKGHVLDHAVLIGTYQR